MDNKFEHWAESKFQGLTRAELREAGQVFGCNFGPNTKEEVMRVKLCEVVGAGAAPAEPAKVIPIPSQHGRPGLAPTERWEGRRHRVQVHHGDDDKEHKAFVLQWNGDARAFPFDKVCDMPEPYFHILQHAVVKTVKQRPVKDEEGRLERMESYDVSKPRYAYNYMGVTPGTEELPTSILDYWQRKATANNYFRDLAVKPAGRKALIRIYADLTESKGPDYYKDKTSEDILADILQFLGLEAVMLEEIESVLAS
jgi:hypothetical protein